MMELKCQNCGGQLKFDEDDVWMGNGVIMWRNRDKTLTCQSCGSQFVRGDDLKTDKGSAGNTYHAEIHGAGTIVQGNGNVVASGRGVVIGGGNVVVGGSVVGGNLIIDGRREG